MNVRGRCDASRRRRIGRSPAYSSRPDIFAYGFSGFPQSFQTNSRKIFEIRPGPISSTTFL